MYAHRFTLLLLGLVLPTLCAAQPPALRLPDLAAFQRDAVDSTNVTFGPLALGLVRFISQFAGDHDLRSADAQSALRGIRSVQVHNYRFTNDHCYTRSDLDFVRVQLAASGWRPLVREWDRTQGADVDVYYAIEGPTIQGLEILVAAPQEFTAVNIVGAVDLDRIATLRHTFVPGELGPP